MPHPPPPVRPTSDHALASDIAAVARIDAVRTILDVVCRTTGMGFSAVARVTSDRWIACAVRDDIDFGLRPGGELEIRTTICDEIRDSGQPVVIDHVAEDKAFCKHHTPARYGFQSYISVPIILPSGEFFGTLCAIDPRPAKVNTPETIGMFTLFADLIGQHLHAQERLATSEAALLGERETARLREEFIAVLGHDLRNPLAAIRVMAGELELPIHTPGANEIGKSIQQCVTRMGALIADVLDFARGRLGSGIDVNLRPAPELANALEHVINELQVAWPERTIRRAIDISLPVSADVRRLCQLASNLVANALTHGSAASTVHVRARTDHSGFELSVTNSGEPIPAEVLANLFQPFRRGSLRPGMSGLGLGLYIASQIARGHGGTLDVVSDERETRFTFRMP